jgi:hypothetical protein
VDGVGKVWCPRSHVRRLASTCFAFMLPKNQVGAVDLFAGTEGGTLRVRGVSNKGVSSSLFWDASFITLTRSIPVPFQPASHEPMAGRCRPM